MTGDGRFDRRELLRRGARWGTLAAGATMASTALAACSRSGPAPDTTTTVTRVPGESDWRRLAASLTGPLVRPHDPSYGGDRLLYNSRFTDLRPLGIAFCETVDDVARCVDFAANHVVQLAARSGGHSYGGYSSCEGLVVDVSRLSSVRVDPVRRTATVGAGARWIDVYDAVGRAGLLVPAGSCPTVGVAGLTLGGGVGVFARRFGLTCDNLASAQFVSADARRLTADGATHPDLLWASRGGGGGNFAIVTALEFTLHEIPALSLFSLRYPWSAAEDMLGAWQHWVAEAPDELWTACQLFSEGDSGLAAQINGVFCGPAEGLSSLVARLRQSIGARPTSSFVGGDDYLDAMKAEAGCSRLSLAACHLEGSNRLGVLGHEAYSAKSGYLDGPSSPAGLSALVRSVESLAARAPTLGGGLAFDSYGGAVNRVAPEATAFVHRDKLAGIQASYSWSSVTTAAEIAAGQAWLTWLGSAVLDRRAGAYQNYIDPTLVDWATAYYGSNLSRLVEVKKKYDRDNLFTFAQSIPTSMGT